LIKGRSWPNPGDAGAGQSAYGVCLPVDSVNWNVCASVIEANDCSR
jgi:hypothetical protein